MRAAVTAVAAVLLAATLPALATPPRSALKIFFGANRVDLSQQGLNTIKIAVQDFARQPRGTLIRVVAHTDGAERDRWALSQRRAEVVKAALVRGGVSAAIVTEGRGDNDPLIPNKEGADEPQNRRAEIWFIPP